MAKARGVNHAMYKGPNDIVALPNYKIGIIMNGGVAVIDACDYQDIRQYRWFLLRTKNNMYVQAKWWTWLDGERQHHYTTLHRLLMHPSPGLNVDHIDGNGLNN